MKELKGNAELFEGKTDIEDLFNGQNMIDLENANFVNENGVLMEPVKATTNYDKLLGKFLVPIFIGKDDVESFNGNGVIVDDYLITAAHVANCKHCKRAIPHLYYQFEGDFFELNDSMVIHDGRGEDGMLIPDKDGIHDDLIVYKLDSKYNSFKFSPDKAPLGLSLDMKPYRFWKGNISNKNEGRECVVISDFAKEQEKSVEKWTNCCTVRIIMGSEKGDSGSALYSGNILYGILIRGAIWGNNNKEYSVLEAQYIKQMIIEAENCNERV